jgi:hypothetical protein
MTSLNPSRILTILKRAQADIEELVAVAGVDPHSQEDMLVGNYAAQWDTLQALFLTIQQAAQWLPTEDTQAVLISDLPLWRDKARRLKEIGKESDAIDIRNLARLIELDEERAEIEAEMAAYFVSLLHPETSLPN